jgi:hypothetical protein
MFYYTVSSIFKAATAYFCDSVPGGLYVKMENYDTESIRVYWVYVWMYGSDITKILSRIF